MQEIIVNMIDGSSCDGVLEKNFHPIKSKFEFKKKESNEEVALYLSKISTIKIVGIPIHIVSSSGTPRHETIETINGETYHVAVQNDPIKYKYGFFAVPTDLSIGFEKIFFTFNGIKKRKKDQPITRIWEDNKTFTTTGLSIVLEKNEDLKLESDETVKTYNPIPTVSHPPANIESFFKLKANTIGEILLESGAITIEQLKDALDYQKQLKQSKRLGEILLEKKYLKKDDLLLGLATKFHMKFVDLDEIEEPASGALQSISKSQVFKWEVLPIYSDESKIIVATSQPTNFAIQEDLKFHTSKKIEMVVASPDKLKSAINLFYGTNPKDNSIETFLDGVLEDDNFDPNLIEASHEDEIYSNVSEHDTGIIKIVNKILLEAYKKGASDIHIEPGVGKNPIMIRYRVDGACMTGHKLNPAQKNAIISRLKIMSKLDIAEKRKPQSGKIVLTYNKQKIEFRLEITPTIGNNEDAVLRLLSSSKPLSLEELCLSKKNLKHFKEIISKPYGLILVVGPTGSGKTTTLHSALHILNTDTKKIWTAEDPVEITQDGLRQVQVNSKIGFGFPEALRSFLRADPDIVMIGEMRDKETAKIGVEASLTGHLVFSTLHTNSAPEAAVRLIEMGVDPFNFTDALLGVLAQRLVRTLCKKCKTLYTPDHNELIEIVKQYSNTETGRQDIIPKLKNIQLYKNVGCEICSSTGYKGRMGIHELMIGTDKVKQCLKANADISITKNVAIQEGMRTLKMDGIIKVLQGYTDIHQVNSVCN
ncbi:MAG: type II/IV secretion system protein [Desulfobacterales bacterium]|nr:type II/IV secretion system protein [Desulfobacterales bacterium]